MCWVDGRRGLGEGIAARTCGLSHVALSGAYSSAFSRESAGGVCTLWGMTISAEHIEVGKRVVVTQQIPHGTGTFTSTVEGVVVAHGAGKTGSWFAHTADGKVWLDRLELRKDDGEMVVCNLDRYSRVETAEGAAGAHG